MPCVPVVLDLLVFDEDDEEELCWVMTIPASVELELDVPGWAAAASTCTPRSGASPMTFIATTPAIAVTRTPAAAPSTGSRR